MQNILYFLKFFIPFTVLSLSAAFLWTREDPMKILATLGENNNVPLVIVTVLGWGIISYLNSFQDRKNLRDSARLKIYQELYELKKEVDDAMSDLSIALMSFSLPFTQMKWSENPTFTTVVEGKNALQIWNEYVFGLSEKSSRFSDAHLKFYTQFNAWTAVMPSLLLPRDILFHEVGEASKMISAHHYYLLPLNREELDWKQWDHAELTDRADQIHDYFNRRVIPFMTDFMDLVHNELAAPVLGNKKVPREDYNYRKRTHAEILTKKGIKEKWFPPTRGALLMAEKRAHTERL